MLIYLYSKNLGFKGGGAKSSLTTKKYLNLLGHRCVSFSNVNVLEKAIKNKKPKLILHHNIINMYKVLRLSKKFNISLIIKVNGLITCGKGTHYKNDKVEFGEKCLKCSFLGMAKCAVEKRKGYKCDDLNKIKSVVGVPFRFFKLKLRLHCLNKADAVIAVGSTLRQILIKNSVKNKIYVCPQPIDDEFLKTNKKIIKPNIKEFNRDYKAIDHFNKSKKKKIIFGTGLHSEKGALVFLKAFYELDRDDTELFIIGKTYPYVDYSVYKPFVGRNVYFTGKVSLDEMKNFYRKATFLAHPSLLFEPFGRVWAEALLHKCPVLAIKDRGCPNDYLIHNKEAYFCGANLMSLKKSIEIMLDNKKLRNKLAINGYKYAKKNLVGSVVVKKLIGIYEEVFNEKR